MDFSPNAFFISVIVFSISRIYFDSFLDFSISLLTLPFCSFMLSIFFHRALSILIIVLLNSWSDNSNIAAILQSGSHVCSDFSSNCVRVCCCCFCLLVVLVIFWKPHTMFWVKGETVCAPIIRYQSFSELVLLACEPSKWFSLFYSLMWGRKVRVCWSWVFPFLQVA